MLLPLTFGKCAPLIRRLTSSFWISCLSLCVCKAAGAVQYHILGLVPFSGHPTARGWAQWQGMKLAIEEKLYLVNAIDGVKATFTVNDSKCDALTENRLVLEAYRELSEERHLVVIGGGCPPINQQISLGALYTRIPQILFEVSDSKSWNSFPVSVRANAEIAVLNYVTDFLHLQNWKQIVLMHDKYTKDASTEWLDDFSIEVSVNVNVSNFFEHPDILKTSRLRVILLLLDHTKHSDVVCRCYNSDPAAFVRYIWLLVVNEATQAARSLYDGCLEGYETEYHRIFFFQKETVEVNTKVSQIFSHVISSDLTLSSNVTLQLEAAFGYDATTITLNCLRAVGGATFTKRSEFVQSLAEQVRTRRWLGVTGNISIDEVGRRRVGIYTFSYVNGDESFKLVSLANGARITDRKGNMERDTIDRSTRLEGIPLSLFIVMCSLAALGIAYAIAIMVFNLMKREHKVIKMTSPNINVIIMFGCCGIYGSVVILGLDTTLVSRHTMEKLMQSATYVIAIGFSLVYGLISAKSWRVFMIFKNLSANGKVTRDEHLLLGAFVMILLDLVVLISWHLTDPITCSRVAISEVFEPENMTDVTTEVDVCSSSHQGVWIPVLYVYKLLILGLGFIFSWQTRHVTLPALRDAQMINITICLIITMAFVCLPLLVIHSTGGVIKYAVGALILWVTVTFTITLLFATKVFLYKKEAERTGHGEAFRFQFSESMKRTQEAIRKLAGCLCCGIVGEDKYAQEMLLTEIECLKRTIKDKDVTIRELNDRLYVGAQKFHEYLKSPHPQENAMKQMTGDTLYKSQTSSLRDDGASVNHVMYVERNSDANSSAARTMKTHSMSDGRGYYIHKPIPQQGCQHASNCTNLETFRTSQTANHCPHRRFSGQSVQSRHGHEMTNTSDMPVYTITVHRPTLGSVPPVDLYPPVSVGSRDAGVRGQENRRTKVSPNFDSAIDSNSPSSSSSADSFQDHRRPSREQTQFVTLNNDQNVLENVRSRDARSDVIDLEAIENEVANSHQACTAASLDTRFINPCLSSVGYPPVTSRNINQTNRKQQTSNYHPDSRFDSIEI